MLAQAIVSQRSIRKMGGSNKGQTMGCTLCTVFGDRLGGHRTGVSFSRGTSQDGDIANRSKAGVARSIERQVLIGSNRRSCPCVLDVVDTVLDPASGIPVSIV
ncbi:hypothetical protein L3X38_004299 [Prunus dulcis]|uniref:Uncharacterized protein n=1 Tax=Prunus dulcis TaxID=3755 RepID=A0AAD5F345_PRUDU|nr:hypothetical protein L3X38_004299 [Prunus dulcis]